MAEESGESPAELRRQITLSREALARDVGGLQYELDFPLKIRKSFQRNTVIWVGSALALGLLIALLRARPQKIYVNGRGRKVTGGKALLETGVLVSALKLLIPVVQPMILNYLGKKMARPGDRVPHR